MENHEKPAEEQEPKKEPETENTDPNAQVKLKQLELWGKLMDFMPPILEYFTKKLEKHDAPIAKSTLWGFLGLIVIILIGTGALLAYDKIDKSNFTFIVGSVLGYLFSMAKMFINGKNQE